MISAHYEGNWSKKTSSEHAQSPWRALLITSGPRIDLPNEGEEDLSTQTPYPSSIMEALLENKKSHQGKTRPPTPGVIPHQSLIYFCLPLSSL